MSSRAALPVAVAGGLLLGAVVLWRGSRPGPEPAAPAPAPRPADPASAPVVVESQPEGSKSRPELLRERLAREEATPEMARELLSFIRDALTRNPEDLSPLALVDALPEDRRFEALLELAKPPSPVELRYESLKRLGEGGWNEERIRKISPLFEAEPEADLRVQILLGATKSEQPAAVDLARLALKDRDEGVRQVGLTALNPERKVDCRTLIDVATSDASANLRGTAALQLGARGAEPEVRAALLLVLHRDASDENRKLAVTALKREALRGEPSVVEALRRSASQDPSAEVQAAARAVLAGLTPGK